MRTKLLAWLLMLFFVALLGFLAYFFSFSLREMAESDFVPQVDQNGTRIPPPPRPEDYIGAQPSHGFQVVVSYVGGGFEPAAVQIRQGDTVRFTNNSSGQLWVASSAGEGKSLYPGTSDCGASRFDTCRPLKPLEFWEFTFGTKGEWHFRNNTNQAHSGIIYVE